MDVKSLVAKLSPLERKVLPLLSKFDSFNDLIDNSGLKDVEVMRALQWLENKKILVLKEEVEEVVLLGKNGKEYVKKGLPEKRFLRAIKENKLSLGEIGDREGLNKEELNICIGVLKSKAAIVLNKESGLIISITDNGKKLLEKESLEEQFLKKDFPVVSKELKDEERFAFDNLSKRKEIIRSEVIKTRFAEVTKLGKEILKKKISIGEVLDKLTPGMLKTGKWKKKKFRAYDVEINVPKINRGKRHFVNQAVKSTRKIWMDMGFQEMTGDMVQSSFWNFDALFTAQDHPVRDLHDTFFIGNPLNAKLPDVGLVGKVKKTHEDGWTTGSEGWGYKWLEDDSKRNVLRTHTTCLSAQTIAKLKKEDLPAKFFALGKCFRNETLDWSHLFEFNQTEGIVIDPNANFSHLIGYLKEFFKKMGYEKARFRPAYFPYTEPSLEIDVFHPVRKEWVELGGAGIFRPEVVKPLLGIDVPVLAWGPGFDRMILEFFKINDIRELYKNDLKQLREMKEWMK